MSSREKPSAVCVRSLVPKLKKSACPAISPARAQARGSSIIVPIMCPVAPRGGDLLDEVAHQRELAVVGDQRHHDLDLGPGHALGREKIASTCIR